MITKLKKYTFLVYHREHQALLNTLLEEGVVHIIEKGRSEEEDESAGELTSLLKRYDRILKLLRRAEAGNKEKEESYRKEDRNHQELLTETENLFNQIDELKTETERLKNEAAKTESWGYYEAADLKRLSDSGWEMSFFSVPSKRFNPSWEEQYSLDIISRERGKVFFVVVHKPGELIDIDADPEKPGEVSAPILLKKSEEIESKIESINKLIGESAAQWIGIVESGRTELLNNIEYDNAEKQAVSEADGRLFVVQGWIPAESEESLKAALNKTECYYLETEPEQNEHIPVKLKNNSFSKLFEPISKLFALPDYRELDLTPFFAPFFMMFFGFCLGDAGYGLLFIVVAFLLYNRVSDKLKPILSLAKYLGIATVLFGMISGTFFGMNLIDSGYTVTSETITQIRSAGVPAPLVKTVSELEGVRFEKRSDYINAIAEKRTDAITAEKTDITRIQRNEVKEMIIDGEIKENRTAILKSAEPDFSLLKSFRHLMQEPLNMFYLAVIIGAFQIIFGMVIRIVNTTIQKGFKYSLSTVGWVTLILTLVVFVGGKEAGLLVNGTNSLIFKILLVISGVMIFLLNNPAVNVFLRIGSGVWDSYNIITGVFGDLLSYIRLFALGISSAILGFVFNEISAQFLSIPYIGWLPFILLLVIGHSINIFMASLGGFIHPMRLTFVEFYKNAGFKGGGREYKPFRINK